MTTDLAISNVVVAANQLNPSIFKQLWLVKNGIVDEDDFGDGCLFSDPAVSVESEKFRLLVVPPQLQFVPKVPPEEQEQLVIEKVGAVVEALPHTPYTAVGLNFFWHLRPEDGNVPALTRRLFHVPEKPLFRQFESEDSRFGGYFSKDILGCRLKLDIKPVFLPPKEEAGNREVLQFAFNFHLDIPQDGEDAVTCIQRQLECWNDARDEATKIVKEATP
jgi:hypothetical protein